MLATGGGGKWCDVDRNGCPIVLPKNYFNNHPIYSNIYPVVIDGQDMLRIPKFYIKYEKINISNDPRGLPLNAKIKYISPELLPDYDLYPAFRYNNIEVDEIYLSINISCTLDSGNKLNSYKDKRDYLASDNSTHKYPITTWQQFANNRNVNGITGFSIPNIYQWAAFQTLALANRSIINYLVSYNPCFCSNCSYDQTLKRIIIGNRNNISTNITTNASFNNITLLNTAVYIVDTREHIDQNYNLNDVFLPRIVTQNVNEATFSGSAAIYLRNLYRYSYYRTSNQFGCGFTDNNTNPTTFYGRLAKY